jgi:hypothetical protein
MTFPTPSPEEPLIILLLLSRKTATYIAACPRRNLWQSHAHITNPFSRQVDISHTLGYESLEDNYDANVGLLEGHCRFESYLNYYRNMYNMSTPETSWNSPWN